MSAKVTYKRPFKHWSNNQKRKYLIFVGINKQRIEMGVLNKKFYEKMANYIGSNKAASNCQNFHNANKQKYQSIDQIVNSVAKEIQFQMPELQTHFELLQIRRKKKKGYYECLENTRMIQDVVLEEFIKSFDPNEILYEPSIVDSDRKSQSLKQSKQCYNIFQSVSTKLYPIEKHTVQENNILLKKEFQKLFNLNRKEQQNEEKSQKLEKLSKKRNSRSYWDDIDILRYLVFIMKYQAGLQSKHLKSTIFKKMEIFMELKNYNMCRKFHYDMKQKFKSHGQIINKLQQVVSLEEQEILSEIERIQAFYQTDLKLQLSYLKQVQISLTQGSQKKNQTTVYKIVKNQFSSINSKIQFDESNQKQSYNQIITQQNNRKNHFEGIQIEIPILMSVTLIKQLNQKISCQKHNQNSQLQNNNMQLEQSFSQTENNKEKQNKQQTKGKKNTKTKNKYKKKLFWSIAQRIKLIVFAMINFPKYLDISKDKRKQIFAIFHKKISEFLHTGKNPNQIYYYFKDLKSCNNKNLKKGIEKQSRKLGITYEMIKQRAGSLNQAEKSIFKIGALQLEISSLPFQLKHQNNQTNPQEDIAQKIASKILEANPPLSCHLKFLEESNEQEKETNIRQKVNKDHTSREQDEDTFSELKKEELDLQANITLAISEESFNRSQQGKQINLESNELQGVFYQQDKILVRFKMKQKYKFT